MESIPLESSVTCLVFFSFSKNVFGDFTGRGSLAAHVLIPVSHIETRESCTINVSWLRIVVER